MVEERKAKINYFTTSAVHDYVTSEVNRSKKCPATDEEDMLANISKTSGGNNQVHSVSQKKIIQGGISTKWCISCSKLVSLRPRKLINMRTASLQVIHSTKRNQWRFVWNERNRVVAAPPTPQIVSNQLATRKKMGVNGVNAGCGSNSARWAKVLLPTASWMRA